MQIIFIFYKLEKMETPAERVLKEIDTMVDKMPAILKLNIEIQKAYGVALLNAKQAYLNFKEIEKLTRNIERLN